MKTVVLPDIHTKFELAQKVLDKESCDRVVCHGDYFDDKFFDSLEINALTAQWVKEKLKLKNHDMLLGNHDLPYRYEHIIKCSGWTKEKQAAIDCVLTEEDWSKFKLYTVVDGWLLTHAGLTSYNVHPKVGNILNWLDVECNDALNDPVSHWLFAAGESRGGFMPYGGITWCDARKDFNPINGIKQCFGHTVFDEPRWIDEENVCLDTHFYNFAIINNGKLTIYDI